jgi:hypothetical protein
MCWLENREASRFRLLGVLVDDWGLALVGTKTCRFDAFRSRRLARGGVRGCCFGDTGSERRMVISDRRCRFSVSTAKIGALYSTAKVLSFIVS